MRLLFLFTLIIFFSSINAQQVGINRINPEHTLDVRSTNNTDPAGLNVSNQDKSKFIRLFSGSDQFPDPSIAWDPNYNFVFATYDDNTFAFTEYMRIASNGYVGIGVTNPEARLDILGGDWNLDAGNPGDFRIGNVDHNFRIGIATGGGGAGITRMYTNSNNLLLGTVDRMVMTLNKNANVGIGTTSPQARLEIHSAGISDTLLLLNNQINNVGLDYGVYFDDKNASPTIGGYFKSDKNAIVAESDCVDCDVILATSNTFTGDTRTITGLNKSEQGVGVQGTNSHADGTGVRGFVSSSGSGDGVGVLGESYATNGVGVDGYAVSRGIRGQGLIGVEGFGNSVGVRGEGSQGMVAVSYSSTGIGLKASNYATAGTTTGIRAEVNSSDGIGLVAVGPMRGVYGFSSASNANGVGLYGRATGASSKGVHAESIGLYGKGVHAKIESTHSSANAILAEWGGGSSYAGYFIGRVHVSGVLSKSSGSFKIDHPLDPENKYLSHSFVESPDMMNIYNGNIITDKSGNASVTLPDYFEALNMEFRYQLTVIGEFAQAIIGEKIKGNSFVIKTDKPNVEVSWQVTGVRKDAFAQKNRIQVEEQKEVDNIGRFLNPEAFNKDQTKAIGRIQVEKK